MGLNQRLNFGKVALCQLSYSRIIFFNVNTHQNFSEVKNNF